MSRSAASTHPVVVGDRQVLLVVFRLSNSLEFYSPNRGVVTILKAARVIDHHKRPTIFKASRT